MWQILINSLFKTFILQICSNFPCYGFLIHPSFKSGHLISKYTGFKVSLVLISHFGIQISCSVVSHSLRPHESQHARPPCPSPSPRVHSNSRPLSQWCHPAISSSVVPFSSFPQSLPASESFPMNWPFTSGGQSIGASTSVLPMNIQGWFPLGLTGLISLQSKGLSRVFFSTAVQKHQFFSTQTSLQSNFHIYTWLLKKTIALTIRTFVSKVMSLLFNMLSRFITAFLPRSKRLF